MKNKASWSLSALSVVFGDLGLLSPTLSFEPGKVHMCMWKKTTYTCPCAFLAESGISQETCDAIWVLDPVLLPELQREI